MKLCTTQWMLILFTASGLIGADNMQPAGVMMEAARKKEVVDGDLKGAIKLYGEVAARHKSDRAVAAMALVRMAEAYQKMGDSESRKIYERVVSEYGDQNEAVTAARARLGENANSGRPATTLTLIGSGPKARLLGFFGGRVSPDGNYLSFTDWDTGDLALHEIATGRDRRLTKANEKKGVFAEGSVISRDGKLIAYNWQDVDKAELRIANLTGDPSPRRLYQNPEIDWYVPWDLTPDGRRLAVQMFKSDKTQQIGLVNILDGSLRVLKSIDWRGTRGMSFSPDGRYLAYDLPEGDANPKHDIYILATDGSWELAGVVHRADDVMMGWSPDGKYLLFGSDRSGATDLWGLPIANGKPQGPPELLRAGIGRVAESKGVTRSGALFYATNTGDSQPAAIHVSEFDSASQKRVSEGFDITHNDSERNMGPVWSPDGRYLAHTSMRVGPGSRPPSSNPGAGDTLVIRSADTYEVVRQWRGKLSYFYAYTLRWTPDSHWVLVQGTDLKGRTGIFRIDIETGNVSPVRVDEPGGPWMRRIFALSRDGRKLYFSQGLGAGENNVIERDLISGQEMELMRGPEALQVGRVSPDGRTLAVGRSDPSGKSTILVLLPLGSGERREISVPARVVPDQCWAPDGRSLIVLQPAEGAETRAGFWSVPADGGTPTKVQDAFLCRVHPDGRRAAYSVSENVPRKQEVWKLENFLPSGKSTK